MRGAALEADGVQVLHEGVGVVAALEADGVHVLHEGVGVTSTGVLEAPVLLESGRVASSERQSSPRLPSAQ